MELRVKIFLKQDVFRYVSGIVVGGMKDAFIIIGYSKLIFRGLHDKANSVNRIRYSDIDTDSKTFVSFSSIFYFSSERQAVPLALLVVSPMLHNSDLDQLILKSLF